MIATHMLDEAPRRPAQVIYVGEDYPVPFTAEPGDTIIVIMNPDGAPIDRCWNNGGQAIENPFTTILTCEGVDF